jgi:hypothetical protein
MDPSVSPAATILLSWAAAAGAFVGIGCLARRDLLARGGAAAAFWSGWSWTMAALLCWHFLLPVDGRFTALALTAGAAGLWRGRAAVRAWFAEAVRSPARRLSASLALFSTSWLALRALGPMENGDDGLYHLLSTRWAAELPIVPGLINLQGTHPNQVHHLLAAAFDVGPLAHRSFHVLGGLAIAALVAQSLSALVDLVLLRGAAPARALLAALLLPPALDLGLGRELTSLSPDHFVFAAGAALVLRLAAQLEAGLVPADLLELALLGAGAVLTKLSASPLVAGLCCAVALRVASGREPALRPRHLALPALVAGLLALLFAARGIVTTGYPLWPSSLAGVAADWACPLEEARATSPYLRDLARGAVRGGSGAPAGGPWIGRWLLGLSFENRRVLLPIGLAACILGFAAAAAALTSRRRGAGLPGGLPGAGGILSAVLAALGVWAVAFPETRYAGALFWLLPALAAGWVAGRLGDEGRAGLVLLVAASSIAAALWPFTAPASRALPRAGLLTPAPIPATQPYRTASGALVRVPVEGFCWDAPLPCTNSPRPDLEERTPGDLAGGYRIRRAPAAAPRPAGATLPAPPAPLPAAP